ncbi:hypothetical protein [Zhongshania sp.]|uniref:hypothetical protein n=1 Tax=Zhongshania sp. TaxID=1971902 RepID=UPI003561A59A
MNIEDLLPYILTRAKGCPEPTANEAVITAAREFLERTRAWNYERVLPLAELNLDTSTVNGTTFDTIDSDTGEISPSLPADSVLHDISFARMDGQTITPIALQTLDEERPDWRDEYGAPENVTQISIDKIRLVPRQDTGDLFISVKLKPAYGATTLPDFMGTQYRKAIRAGALAEIFSIPGEVFTNPGLADAHKAEFMSEIGRYLNAGTKGQIRARRGVKARFY